MLLGQCGFVYPKLSIKLQKEMAALVKMPLCECIFDVYAWSVTCLAALERVVALGRGKHLLAEYGIGL